MNVPSFLFLANTPFQSFDLLQEIEKELPSVKASGQSSGWTASPGSSNLFPDVSPQGREQTQASSPFPDDSLQKDECGRKT